MAKALSRDVSRGGALDDSDRPMGMAVADEAGLSAIRETPVAAQ
tara:strand:+ start:492 stop:623 length:132 start_codon:yes stop_codon:yes gene_type:complete